jgi:hypothetical protein
VHFLTLDSGTYRPGSLSRAQVFHLSSWLSVHRIARIDDVSMVDIDVHGRITVFSTRANHGINITSADVRGYYSKVAYGGVAIGIYDRYGKLLTYMP